MTTKKNKIKAVQAKKSVPAGTARKIVKKTATAMQTGKNKTVAVKAVKRSTPVKKLKTVKPAAIAAAKTRTETAAVKPLKTKKKLTERDERLHTLKMTLLRQRSALLNGAESALNELPGQAIFPDLGDQATAETDRNFMLRLRGREQRLLKKIDEAIDRIDSGTFGICEDCGNEIDIKRLEVRPVTTMCIECKTLQEEEEKLREV